METGAQRSPEIWVLGEMRAVFFFLPWGRGLARQIAKWAGVGTWLQRGNGSGTNTRQPAEKGQEEGIAAQQRCLRGARACACVSSSQGLLWSRSRHPRLGLRALTQHQVAVAISPLL